jgi:LAO/AO transport system kinase
MASLSVDPNAFIRPSPASGTLGGVTRSTREAIVVVEAAGFDLVLVETVGVGQSETAVANMVDTFLVLLLARSGDSLQGIKKGVLELADVLTVNKADGPHVLDAQRAARELADVLHMLEPADPSWSPPVLTCSAVDRTGLVEVWAQVEAHRNTLVSAGTFVEKRQRQEIEWMWAMVDHQLLGRHREDPRVRERIPSIEEAVRKGSLTPTLAATELVALVADGTAS